MIKLYKHFHQSNREVSLTKVQKDISKANNSGRLARIFNSREITKAINNFSSDNLRRSGGFGEVFKAILDDGTITAVKRAKLGNTKGNDQSLNEVRILCQVNHRRLIKLLGCCVELEQPLLIYEHVPNGHFLIAFRESNLPIGHHLNRITIFKLITKQLKLLHIFIYWLRRLFTTMT